MLEQGSLRARLGQLARDRKLAKRDAQRRRAAAARDTSLQTEALGVEEFLPGGEWRDDRGTVWIHERLRSQVEKRRSHWGTLGEPGELEDALHLLRDVGLSRALFLDLETGGLASSPVFLAGTMHWNGEDFVLRQYFARHYGEEATLIGALHDAAKDFEVLVTFNGKSYDVPFLRGRALVHGVPLRVPPLHVDLLHPSRRRWADRLRDCRLQTLESRICRRHRSGDVPSDEVPGLYHDFVRRGDAYRLVPVFHHNLLDVITMAEILRALCRAPKRRRMGDGELSEHPVEGASPGDGLHEDGERPDAASGTNRGRRRPERATNGVLFDTPFGALL